MIENVVDKIIVNGWNWNNWIYKEIFIGYVNYFRMNVIYTWLAAEPFTIND